jgi:hypothetical protein
MRGLWLAWRGCMCESGEGEGDEMIRARFEEMESRK